MKTNFRGLLLVSVLLLLNLLPKISFSQYAAIQHTNMQIYGVLHGKQVAWATNKLKVKVNKETGNFEIEAEVNDFHLSASTPEFQPDSTLNEGKKLKLYGKFPIEKVLGRRLTLIDVDFLITAGFNDIEEEINFTFTVLLLAEKGFSVMGKGAINPKEFNLQNLKDFENNLFINLSFIGY